MELLEAKAQYVDYRKLFSWKPILTLADLKAILDPVDVFAFDTETTGLDYLEAKVAGFSFSTNGKVGYYVPLRHKLDDNAPRECLDYIVEKIKTARMVLMYNKKFDLNMLEVSEGYILGHCLNVMDVMALVWLRDCDIRMPALKDSSEWYLGIRQPKFEEVSSGLTFDYVRVGESCEYASLDSITTYLLFEDTLQKYPDLKGIFKIDNIAIEALRRIEHTLIPVDTKFLVAEQRKCEENILKFKKDIFDIVGYTFNPDSNAQKAEALMTAGVRLTARTEASDRYAQGQWKVNIETLESLDHPLAKLLVKFSEEQKYYGSYVKKLLEESERGIRINYLTTAAPTGRLASGGDKKNRYYSGYNIQSVPKAEQINVGVIRDVESPTGWKVIPLEDVIPGTEHYVCESGSYEHGIRAAFVPKEDEIWVSIDYRQEELRIACNFSGERVWADAFLSGRDIHQETAKAIFGEHADKNDRKKAKIANFSILYGASEYTFSKKFGMSIDAARQFIQRYYEALPSLSRWKSYHERRAVTQDVFTFFGRPRRMARYFNKAADRKTRSFGYRTAVNTVVQGTAADLIRLALGRIFIWKLKNPVHDDKFTILNTVHDEVNSSVKKNWLKEYCEVVPKLMTMSFPEWKVPLEVDVSIGDNWLRLITYKIKDGVFTPKGEYHAN